MDKDNNDYYLANIKQKIDKLDFKKKEHELNLVQQIKLLEQNNTTLQKFKFTNDILQEKYNSLIRMIFTQGIVFEVNFINYKPHQWENLLVVKTSGGYEIQTKAGHTLTMLDKNYSMIISDINKKQVYSLIVIRVTDKVSLVQLRFN